MLTKVKLLLENNKDRASFFKEVSKFFPEGSDDYSLIEKAYATSKDAFRDKYRDDGQTRYFEHLRAVTLIVFVYLRVRDPDIIAASLLHDIIEDVEVWSQSRVALEFNRRISQLVWWVTKPQVEVYNGDKEARNRAYHQNLRRAPREALIIKLSDRLHNMLTLWETTEDKQKRKVVETQDFYLPIAEEQVMLIHELETALSEIESTWK